MEPPNSAIPSSGDTAAGDHFHSHSPPSPSFSDYDYIDDSNCSTPYVSAPSSPGHSFVPGFGLGFFYSAPTSPMHYVLASAPVRSSLAPTASDASSNGSSFEFDFFDRVDSPTPAIGSSTMSSADELFLNGQIRPMKLSAHLERPQPLAPLLDLERENDDDNEEDETFRRSRDFRQRDRSQRRRARSLSPLRSTPPFDWLSSEDGDCRPEKATETEQRVNVESEAQEEERESEATTPVGSRSSSAGRSSKRWDFLKDFLRSKSEGSGRSNKFWHNISFSPAKERERERKGDGSTNSSSLPVLEKVRMRKRGKESPAKKTPTPAMAKRRSTHEMHYYAAKSAQAVEERRKKTFLPYRQGVLGCLGFNSKSYGALNGFARALNPVNSR